MRPPIFICDGFDIQYFTAVDAAKNYLEVEDIRNGIYDIFDSSGCRLHAIIEPSLNVVGLQQPIIELAIDTNTINSESIEAFRERLSQFFSLYTDITSAERLTLPQLINLFCSRFPPSA